MSAGSPSKRPAPAPAPGRIVLDPEQCVIPVPLQLSATPDHQANPRIVRPTPRRPQQPGTPIGE